MVEPTRGHAAFPVYTTYTGNAGALRPGHRTVLRESFRGHVRVALAHRGGHRVQRRELRRRERQLGRADVLLDPRQLARTRDRSDVLALGQQPGQCHLRRRGPGVACDALHDLDDGEVGLQGPVGEARIALAEIVVVEHVQRPDGPGQEAAAQRGVRHEPDSELPQRGQQLALGVARPQRVLGLHGGHRVHGVRPADRRDGGLRQAVAADLPLGDELRERADGVLDGRRGIHPVLVVDVDPVGAQAAQGALDGQPDVLGRAVESPLVAGGVADGAELGGDDGLVAATGLGQRAPEQLLVRVGAVHLGRVEEGDAAVQGAEDRARAVDVVLTGSRVEGADPHQAEADAADLDRGRGSQSGGLHECAISLS